MGGKWLELLKQTAPDVTRAAVLRDATQGSGTSQFAAIQAVAPSLRVEVNPVNMRDAGEVERAVIAFARSPGGAGDERPVGRKVRGMLQSYHEHGISTPECLLIEVNWLFLLHRGNFGF